MARLEVTERTLYAFGELDQDAKERARDWYRGCIESDELADSDDWETVAGIIGIEFKTRPVNLHGGGTRRDPCIYWSVGGSQGDGASFEGSYSYAKGAPAAIRAHAPKDSELHRIADSLMAVQRRHFYALEATMSQGVGSNFYSHSGTMSVDVDRSDGKDCDLHDATDDIKQLMRDFADWIYRRVSDQWDYLHSDESVDESILANEYEFTETGNIA